MINKSAYESSEEMNKCKESSEERIKEISKKLNELYEKYGFVVFDILLQENDYLNRKFSRLKSVRGGYS